MKTCDWVLEVLPWYAIGKLSPDEAAEVAEHLRGCDACRLELGEVLRLRHGVTGDAGLPSSVRERVWRKVTLGAGIRDVAHIDVGSFAIGFRLGLNARRSTPVRASLRVMGQEVRIVGRRTDRSSEPKEAS